jgi:hypothetical protein
MALAAAPTTAAGSNRLKVCGFHVIADPSERSRWLAGRVGGQPAAKGVREKERDVTRSVTSPRPVRRP